MEYKITLKIDFVNCARFVFYLQLEPRKTGIL